MVIIFSNLYKEDTSIMELFRLLFEFLFNISSSKTFTRKRPAIILSICIILLISGTILISIIYKVKWTTFEFITFLIYSLLFLIFIIILPFVILPLLIKIILKGNKGQGN